MAKKRNTGKRAAKQPAGNGPTKKRRKAAADTPGKETAPAAPIPEAAGRPSALLDTRVIRCGDCLEQLGNLCPPWNG